MSRDELINQLEIQIFANLVVQEAYQPDGGLPYSEIKKMAREMAEESSSAFFA